MRTLALAVAVLGSLAVADEPKTDDAKKEMDRFQGTWKMASLEANGEKVPAERTDSARLAVEGDKYTPTFGDQTIPSTFKLDPSKTPKTIDITYKEGPQQGQTVKGIYKLEGDTFTMCRGLTPDEDRPSDFTAAADSGRILVVWKRSKPAESGK